MVFLSFRKDAFTCIEYDETMELKDRQVMKTGGIVMNGKKLYRTEGPDAKLFGVCGGIAEYFGIDPTLVRIGTAILIIPGGVSLWVYIVAALVMPKKSDVYPGA